MLIFIASSSIGFSQSDHTIDKSTLNKDAIESCEKDALLAIEDAKIKVYKYYSYGMVLRSKEELGFRAFYKEYMSSKYGILVGDAGYVVTAESPCYQEKMYGLIQKEFGVNVFESSKKEALKLFDKIK